MRKLNFSAVLMLAILSVAAVTAWSATASFTPPAREGNIFAVVNFPRAGGANQNTFISVNWGPFHRRETVIHGYGNCSSATPAGFVLMIRHLKPDANLFTITTTGRIVRAPYQGEAPPEISHVCYKFVKMRARY
jgi:hypothetical protein